MKSRIGEVITFGGLGNAEPYQLHGWSVGEDGFTWTLDHESTLTLPTPNAPFGFFVELWLNPLILPTIPIQRLMVKINGEVIGEESLTKGGLYAFFATAPDRATPMILTIGHPNFYRGGPNERCTAFAMKQIRILLLEEPLGADTCRASAVPIDNIADAERATGLPIGGLVTNFEMLAGDCEFGGVQRFCGGDPLGLLRFAGASPEVAIRGLERDFDGIGMDLAAEIADNAIAEWMIHDRNYNLRYHSMISSRDVPEAEALRREGRKVAFLKRKFLEDISEAQKIFVFADRNTLPRSGAMPLFLALRRKAAHTLLWIKEDAVQAGQVQELCPGLFVGYVTNFAGMEANADVLPQWLAALGNAYLLACTSNFPSVWMPNPSVTEPVSSASDL